MEFGTTQFAHHRIPATNKENALWLLERLVPGSGLNNIGIAFQVAGKLRADGLEASIAVLLSRYETIRTVYFATDTGLEKEVVSDDALKVAVERLEISGGRPEEELSQFVGRPFDLDGRLLLRVGIAAHPEGDIVCVAAHHLVFDATSSAIFLQTLIPVYEAVVAGRPAPAGALVQALAQAAPAEADLGYWRESLRGFVPDSLDLWCGVPRVRRPLMTGDSVRHTLSPRAQAAIAQLQRQARAPIAAVLLAAYYALLAAHGAGPELVIGTPLDLRGPQDQPAIGYHVNVVPLRLRVDLSEGFRQLARRTRDMFFAAMAHANVSVDDLSAELPRTGSSWQTTLYRHMFNYLPGTASHELSVDGMAARTLAVENGFSKFDLELFVMPATAGIWFRYCDEILARADAEALLRRYEAMLVAAAEDPDQPLGEIAGWSESDRVVIDTVNETARPVEPPTLLAAFRARVLAAPDAAAVIGGGSVRLTYRELWAAATAVRDLLRGHGAGPGDVVAVVAPGKQEAVAAAFGVWLAGAAYLPLSAAGGRDLTQALAHSTARAALAGSGVRLPAGAGLPPVLPIATGQAAASWPPASVDGPDPLAPACVLHAAGEPAATVLSHRGVANLVSHFAAELAAGQAVSAVTLADVTSPGSLLELFLPLSTGGSVIVAPDGAENHADALRAVLGKHPGAIVQMPAGGSARVLAEAVAGSPGSRIIASWDDLQPAAAARLLAAGCQVHAVYGTAATTGWALSGWVDARTRRISGRPIGNARAFVATPDGRELPTGVRGELCVAGELVAQAADGDPRFGYHARYGHYYRTGQLACWQPSGTLGWLGRIDRKAVIAGSQVDLGEVDSALADHDGVHAAAAFPVATAGGDLLIAFAEAAEDLAGPLRAHALATLPAAAVPERVICVPAMPRNQDGQVDRPALALQVQAYLGGWQNRGALDADDPMVRDLIGLWQQLLDSPAEAHTVFFAAGGHSLLAARLAQDVEELTGIHLELSEVFNHPTPAALAARLRALADDND
jgi:non-ribosomal peptide synthetase component F